MAWHLFTTHSIVHMLELMIRIYVQPLNMPFHGVKCQDQVRPSAVGHILRQSANALMFSHSRKTIEFNSHHKLFNSTNPLYTRLCLPPSYLQGMISLCSEGASLVVNEDNQLPDRSVPVCLSYPKSPHDNLEFRPLWIPRPFSHAYKHWS